MVELFFRMVLNNIDDSIEGIENFLKRNPTTCFVAEENKKIIRTILAGYFYLT